MRCTHGFLRKERTASLAAVRDISLPRDLGPHAGADHLAIGRGGHGISTAIAGVMKRREFLRGIAHLGLSATIPVSQTRLRSGLSAPRLDAHAHVFSPALVGRTRALIADPDIAAAVR